MQPLALAGRGRNLLPSPRSRKEGSMQHTEFIATGFHVPERVVTNAELSQLMDTSDAWITQRSGIKTRYWVSEGETGVSRAREAACPARANAGRTAADPGSIVSLTCRPERSAPSVGSV